ncbi:PREDICTED: CMRF35-like molecule 2, partial [Gavialis gangeticus]|uniref:CMRF35-like molecule 2 n=1 Tax=Gavialis gangeticus TaxID=94835 RepID=UPI00092EFFE2
MRIFLILSWMAFAGCMAVTGPQTVTGPEGGSVSVTCRYNKGYEKYGKFWCREGYSLRCLNGEHILETNGLEAKVRNGHFSLQDNHSLSAFTVTMEHLSKTDAGTYHCGVLRT